MERVVAQQSYRGCHGILRGYESREPSIEVLLLLQSLYGLLGDSALEHVSDHPLGADLLSPAVGVAYEYHVLHAQLVYGHQERPHCLPVRVGEPPSCILYEDHVPVLEAQGRREQVHEPGIHAGHQGGLELRDLRGRVLMVRFRFHELPVAFQDAVYHASSHFAMESSVSASRESIASRSAGLKVPGPLQFPAAISDETFMTVIADATDSTDAPHAPT